MIVTRAAAKVLSTSDRDLLWVVNGLTRADLQDASERLAQARRALEMAETRLDDATSGRLVARVAEHDRAAFARLEAALAAAYG